MNGDPVWLASLSRRDAQGELIPTDAWSRKMHTRSLSLLRAALDGVGDQERERAFRMCGTLCVHRALTTEEAASLPAEWSTGPGEHLAGGSLEVLYEKGCCSPPSTQPCHNPTMVPLAQVDPRISNRRLLFPRDCGRCEPCQARQVLDGRTALLSRGKA